MHSHIWESLPKCYRAGLCKGSGSGERAAMFRQCSAEVHQCHWWSLQQLWRTGVWDGDRSEMSCGLWERLSNLAGGTVSNCHRDYHTATVSDHQWTGCYDDNVS